MSTIEGLGGFISTCATLPSTFDASGYGALSWAEVGEASETPEHGGEHAVVTFTPLKSGIVAKHHGELNFGSMTIPMALDASDAGQIILKAARASKAEIAFRETRSDGSIVYFSGKVFSFKTAQSIGAVVPASCMVEITRDNVDVAA